MIIDTNKHKETNMNISQVSTYKTMGVRMIVNNRKRSYINKVNKQLIRNCLKAGDKYYEICEGFNITLNTLLKFIIEEEISKYEK